MLPRFTLVINIKCNWFIRIAVTAFIYQVEYQKVLITRVFALERELITLKQGRIKNKLTLFNFGFPPPNDPLKGKTDCCV